MRAIIKSLSAACAVAALPSLALAFPQYPELLPNRAFQFSDQTGTTRPCITCHNNPNGGQGCLDGSTAPDKVAPCFNPFGQAFRDNGKVWNAALAAGDADNDGFTNGQELQDPSGTWQVFTPSPGNPAYVTKPGFASETPGTDGDQDGVCWFGRDLNGNRLCTEAGEQTQDFDCDDALGTVNSRAAELCGNGVDNDCDGRPDLTDGDCADLFDNDFDGWCESGRDLNGDRDCLDSGEPSATQNDCDDTQSTTYHGAPENCADQFDNDCNGDIDFDDQQCDGNDDDHDGYCPVGYDEDGDRQCTGDEVFPPGTPGDCLDIAETVVPPSNQISPAAEEICTDSVDNDCDGKADFADTECADLVDGDGDGYCPSGRDLNADGNCASTGEAGAVVDCDDGNAERSPANTEICYGSIDRDCDGLVGLFDLDSCQGFQDSDRDFFCAFGEDINRDRDCVDPDQLERDEYAIEIAADCDETSAVARPRSSEALDDDFAGCFDGLDTDCDGEADAADFDCHEYLDSDRDGFCVYGIDGAGGAAPDGDCTDPGEATPRANGVVDCKEKNAALSPGLQENCVDGKDNNCDGLLDKADPDCARGPDQEPGDKDADEDGFCPLGTDLNGDRDCRDEGENTGSDCDDREPDINSAAQENSVALCKDARDNDCDGFADVADDDGGDCAQFLDNDGDTFCPQGRDNNFNGRCLENSEQNGTRDCDDTSNLAFPGRREVCDDGFDNDCNGLTDALDSEVCECSAADECEDGDPCTQGSCANRHCRQTTAAMCVDAGAVEPDAGLAEDAGSMQEEDAGVSAGPDGDPGEAPPPPKPSTCSVAPWGRGAANAGGALAFALLFIVRARRRRV